MPSEARRKPTAVLKNVYDAHIRKARIDSATIRSLLRDEDLPDLTTTTFHSWMHASNNCHEMIVRIDAWISWLEETRASLLQARAVAMAARNFTTEEDES